MSSRRFGMAVTGGETERGPKGNMSGCQLQNNSFSHHKALAVTRSRGFHQVAEDDVQRRELRLLKNREAARECRRKKKEYVKCLENRVAMLENQNKTLIEELKLFKDIYKHKAE